jgi:hypothetical protein
MKNMLSKYLPYDRAVFSSNAQAHGIPNKPNDEELKNLMLWGEHIYDKVCDKFGLVFTSSVYRNKDRVKDKWGKYTSVNELAGGSPTSGHPNGQCGDLDGDAPNTSFVTLDNNMLFHYVRQNLVYDQVIAEYEENGKPKWVHVGYRASGNRQQALIATKNTAGSTVYMLYSDALYKRIYKSSRDVGDIMDDKFIMPEIDLQTGIDETQDGGYEQEVHANRSASLSSPSPQTITQPVTTIGEDGSMTITWDSGGTTVEVLVKVQVDPD